MKFQFLQKTSVWPALSNTGKRMEMPKGIFYWSSRAKTEANINGTIGIAQDDDGTVSHLPVAEKWAGDCAMKAASAGRVFGYAPIEGVKTLREKWLNYILKNAPQMASNASQPVVTNGIAHSIAISGRLFLDPGQTIITADKSWENYFHIFNNVQGVKVETFELFDKDGGINVESLGKILEKVAAAQKKVVLLLNFPHNQTGFMPSRQQCEALGKFIADFCKKSPAVPFVVLLDDAYECYVYDEIGLKYSPLAHVFNPFPNFCAVKLDGISKVMLAYGYRVGFITIFANSLDAGAKFDAEFLKGFRDDISEKIGGFIRGEISQVNHHGQLLADGLMNEFDLVKKQQAVTIDMLAGRWKAMMFAFEEGYKKYGKKLMWPDPCNAGFFCYVNLAEGVNPIDVAERLLKEKKVGIVPSDKGMRIAFAGVPESRIKEMVGAIFEVVYR